MRVTPELVEMIAKARFMRSVARDVSEDERDKSWSFEQLDPDVADAYRDEVREFLGDVDAAGLEVEVKY